MDKKNKLCDINWGARDAYYTYALDPYYYLSLYVHENACMYVVCVCVDILSTTLSTCTMDYGLSITLLIL